MKSIKAMTAMGAMRDCHGKFVKAMKSMKVRKPYSKVAKMVGLQPRQVEQVADAMMALAAKQLNATGSFKLAGAFTMKLTKKPARQTMEGVNPITKEPCVFKARNASQTLRVKPMKKFILMVMFADFWWSYVGRTAV